MSVALLGLPLVWYAPTWAFFLSFEGALSLWLLGHGSLGLNHAKLVHFLPRGQRQPSCLGRFKGTSLILETQDTRPYGCALDQSEVDTSRKLGPQELQSKPGQMQVKGQSQPQKCAAGLLALYIVLGRPLQYEAFIMTHLGLFIGNPSWALGVDVRPPLLRVSPLQRCP